jgi:hypothetical protein
MNRNASSNFVPVTCGLTRHDLHITPSFYTLNGDNVNILYRFNVFHVRAICYTKTLITNKCTKRVLSSIVTHSYMFRPSWVIFSENFFVIITLRLHFIVE